MKDRSKPLLLAVLCVFFGCFGVSAGGMLSTAGGAGSLSPKSGAADYSARSDTSVAIAPSVEDQILKKQQAAEKRRQELEEQKERQEVAKALMAFTTQDLEFASSACHGKWYRPYILEEAKLLFHMESDTVARDRAVLESLRPRMVYESTGRDVPTMPREIEVFMDIFLAPDVSTREKLATLYVALRRFLEEYTRFITITGGNHNLAKARENISLEDKKILVQSFCMGKEFIKRAIGLMRDLRPPEEKRVYKSLLDYPFQFPILETVLFEFYSRAMPKVYFAELDQVWYSPTAEPPAALLTAAL